MKIREYVGLPNGRYRIFSMNGRTNDKDRPERRPPYKAKANVFWMWADNGSVGNFVNPRFTMIDYIELGQKVTLLNIKIDVTYGTQRDVDVGMRFTLRDYIYNIIYPFEYTYATFKFTCSIGPPKNTPDGLTWGHWSISWI